MTTIGFKNYELSLDHPAIGCWCRLINIIKVEQDYDIIVDKKYPYGKICGVRYFDNFGIKDITIEMTIRKKDGKYSYILVSEADIEPLDRDDYFIGAYI